MKYLPLLAALLLVGCGHAPTAPSASGPLRLALAGQSNSILIRPFLAEKADVSSFYGEVTTIAPCWDVTGSCWVALRPQLRQHLDAVIWSQGEADILAQTPDYGPQTPGRYGPALASLVARIRAEAGNPSLLVVIMQKGPWAAYWATKGIAVEAETLAWIEHDAHALYLPTLDEDWRTDGIHMTDQGYRDATARIVEQVHARVR